MFPVDPGDLLGNGNERLAIDVDCWAELGQGCRCGNACGAERDHDRGAEFVEQVGLDVQEVRVGLAGCRVRIFISSELSHQNPLKLSPKVP